MVLHIFLFESEAKQSGPEEKAWRCKSREERDGCEDIIGRGPRELARPGKEPVYAARTVLLRWNASSGVGKQVQAGRLRRGVIPLNNRGIDWEGARVFPEARLARMGGLGQLVGAAGI
jgi:hypothetical protein